MNNATKYVVSTTLASADWPTSVPIGRDVVEQITRLKQEDGPELQVHGSSQLIQTLSANGLRRVPPLDLPGAAGQREAALRRRRHRHLRARRRHQPRHIAHNQPAAE